MEPTALSTQSDSTQPVATQSSPTEWKGRVARLAVGVGAGAALGIGMYLLVGCSTGCVFLSSPILSALYGALVGGVAAYR